MILKDLVLRIRDTCPVFERRVYGSAQMEEGIRQAENLKVPAAFVMVDGDFPSENQDRTVALQEVQERWTVVVVISNKDDTRGQNASDYLHIVRRQLLGGLLGWQNFEDVDVPEGEDPGSDWGPVVYRGSLHVDMNAARLWHQFSFGHNIVIAAGVTHECIPNLKINFRGGPAEFDNSDEDFYEAGSGVKVDPPQQVPHKNPNDPPFPNPAKRTV